MRRTAIQDSDVGDVEVGGQKGCRAVHMISARAKKQRMSGAIRCFVCRQDVTYSGGYSLFH
jgi:hypothetical protein